MVHDGTTMRLAVRGLVQEYGAVRALDGVSFALDEGVTALIGANGAGKSTLLTAVAGGRRPTAGTVEVAGHDVYGRRTRRPAQRRVALVPQLPRFPSNLTAHEVVAYLAWMRGLPSGRAARAADEALERVGLEARRSSKLGSLSGGMLRRVALAQALAGEADVLLLDEPSTGLDPHQRRGMVELLQTLPGTVLISSHVMEDVADLAERIIALHEGLVRFDGTPAGLVERAPAGTAEHRRLEAGFLTVCLEGRAA
ncbi:ABC-2 type transport system ATP-binding protein [Nocardioides zeae]|uniref:ABC-2 type transport system ATP-binding protein n=2 Tax=Nocardioides zeae TaxID=1457234 RepID=A0AAJ1X4Q5_9ACTN|nr:ABC transporter ATP-binding protein [Nocardioides zeae]MDQ1105832.1 ABC-2 type transport system ATP-binding protein [Nocardioides zeae]MDR6174521.1 ABC-2 type transport system ATP-binding protein [Nocardioides zeae]MDR6210593.1 ABC-2 type transport system ATP-binding protein [Nocardioides zeae]